MTDIGALAREYIYGPTGQPGAALNKADGIVLFDEVARQITAATDGITTSLVPYETWERLSDVVLTEVDRGFTVDDADTGTHTGYSAASPTTPISGIPNAGTYRSVLVDTTIVLLRVGATGLTGKATVDQLNAVDAASQGRDTTLGNRITTETTNRTTAVTTEKNEREAADAAEVEARTIAVDALDAAKPSFDADRVITVGDVKFDPSLETVSAFRNPGADKALRVAGMVDPQGRVVATDVALYPPSVTLDTLALRYPVLDDGPGRASIWRYADNGLGIAARDLWKLTSPRRVDTVDTLPADADYDTAGRVMRAVNRDGSVWFRPSTKAVKDTAMRMFAGEGFPRGSYRAANVRPGDYGWIGTVQDAAGAMMEVTQRYDSTKPTAIVTRGGVLKMQVTVAQSNGGFADVWVGPLFDSPPFPHNCLFIVDVASAGGAIYGNDYWDDPDPAVRLTTTTTKSLDFVPADAVHDGNQHGAWHHFALLWAMEAMDRREGLAPRSRVASAEWRGATPLRAHIADTGNFLILIDQIRTAAEAAAGYGCTLEIECHTIWQGEGDQRVGDPDWDVMAAQYITDLRAALVGIPNLTTTTFPVAIVQTMGRATSTVKINPNAVNQLRMGKAGTALFLGPNYDCGLRNNVPGYPTHHTDVAKYQIAERQAVALRWFQEHGSWNGHWDAAVSESTSGGVTTVDVTVALPPVCSQIVLETGHIPAIAGMGWKWVGDSGAEVAVTSVTAVDTNVWRVTMPERTEAGYLTYGMHYDLAVDASGTSQDPSYDSPRGNCTAYSNVPSVLWEFIASDRIYQTPFYAAYGEQGRAGLLALVPRFIPFPLARCALRLPTP